MGCQSKSDQPSSLWEARVGETVFWKNVGWKRKIAKTASWAEAQTAPRSLLGFCGSARGGWKDKATAAREADMKTN